MNIYDRNLRAILGKPTRNDIDQSAIIRAYLGTQQSAYEHGLSEADATRYAEIEALITQQEMRG